MKAKPPKGTRRIDELMNLGPRSLEQLGAVGIRTEADLRTLGPVEAYLRWKARFPGRVTRVALYALEGALMDCHWNELPPKVKADLNAALERASPPARSRKGR
jgi:DNA transformation protein